MDEKKKNQDAEANITRLNIAAIQVTFTNLKYLS